MAIIEDIGEKGLGWPIGIGLIVAAFSAAPAVVKAARPVAKKAIKGYLALQAKAKESTAEVGERMQDLYAEAKHEYEQEVHEQEAEPHPKVSAATEMMHEEEEELQASVKGGSRPRTKRTAGTTGTTSARKTTARRSTKKTENPEEQK